MLTLTIVAAVVVVASIVVVALFGWADHVSWPQRFALLGIGSGLVLAGPDRFAARPPGFGDLLFLTSIAAYLLATYGPALRRRADAADGAADGKVSWRRLLRRAASASALAAAIILSGLHPAPGAHAAPYRPVQLRVAAEGPGRVAVVEVGRFEDRKACARALGRLMAGPAAGKRLTTPDGLTWTVLGARCVADGVAS